MLLTEQRLHPLFVLRGQQLGEGLHGRLARAFIHAAGIRQEAVVLLGDDRRALLQLVEGGPADGDQAILTDRGQNLVQAVPAAVMPWSLSWALSLSAPKM